MKIPSFTMITDGPTDVVMLIPILEWLLRDHCPDIGVQVEYADSSQSQSNPRHLNDRIAFALANYPCDCLFVHRDAERVDHHDRREEIRLAIESLPSAKAQTYICIVPIRMSEAWLLFDEKAIRQASGNGRGKIPLELPHASTIENLPSPKDRLNDLLTTASGSTGRQLKKFRSNVKPHRVAQYIDDFSPLRKLSAFQKLEDDVERLVKERGWNAP